MASNASDSEDAGETLTLDYAQLVQEYESRRETRERGFGMDVDFLDVWVPDPNLIKSVYFLFEAAASHKYAGLSLVLSDEASSEADGDELLNSLRALGGVSVDQTAGKVTVSVAFGASTGAGASLATVAGLSAVHRVYHDALLRETRELSHELKTTVDAAIAKLRSAGKHVLTVGYNDGTVLAGLEPESHRVTMIRHTGLTDSANTRLLDLFCRWLEGSPVQEMAEHGALRLENALRAPNQPVPVRGLMTPTNAGPGFSALEAMARKLYQDYRETHGVRVKRNTNWLPLTQKWLALSKDERLAAVASVVRQCIDAWPDTDIQADVVDVVSESQVFVAIDGTPTEENRRRFVRELENELKTELDPRLELYLPSAKDKLRRDESTDLM